MTFQKHCKHLFALKPALLPAFLGGLAVAAFLCLVPLPAYAQFRGSIQGTVTDPSGAVIPGATVTLTNKQTNQKQESTTNSAGIYNFTALPPDHFSITAVAAGFQKKVINTVAIIPEQANSLNIQLAIGQSSQTVTVSGSTVPALDTETATVSSTITSNQIEHMPSYGRDVFQLAQLTPGVFGNGARGSGGGTNNNPGNQGPGGSSANGGIFQTENGPQIQTRGGRYNTNSITMDGISTVSAVWGGTSVITPSESSVANMKVVSNSYDAENGRFSGSSIEVTTKSGSNHFHGGAFFRVARPGLNAYQRWNGLTSEHAGTPASRGLQKDTSRFNQFGADLGGPLWKNRLFFFFNFEAQPMRSTATPTGWYETPQFDSSAAPQGSIAAKYLSFPGVAPVGTVIPTTCEQAGLVEGVNCNTVNGQLDVGSPLTSGLGHQDLTYRGSTDTPGVGGGLDGVPDLQFIETPNPTKISQVQYNGRVDAQVDQNDRVSFAMFWVPLSKTYFNGPTRKANLWNHTQVNDAFSAIWIHTFSPTLINEARANAAGWRWNEVDSNPQAPFGFPTDNIDDAGSAKIQYFGAPGPSNLNQWTYTYRDVLTKNAGRHNLKFGGELTRLYYLNNVIYASRPNFNFHNLWDFANDAPYHETGNFDHATGVPFAGRQDNRMNIWGFFVQDNYKIRPNLTLNLGLRWSYFGAYYSKQGNLNVLEFGSDTDPLTNMRFRTGGGLVTPSKNNWGPQFGFAWLPMSSNGKAVVRGGFGINYNQNEIAILASGNANPPAAVAGNFTCGYPFPNPTCSGTGILYETASSPTSLFGYTPNPAAIVQFNSNNLPVVGQISGTGFSLHPKTIANYHFSLDVEYQLPFSTVASLAYQGSLMRHLLIHQEWNSIAAARGFALNPKVNSINYWDNVGTGNYNGMVASLNHTFSHGFQAEAMYTWSKSMDENSGPYFQDPYPFNSSLAYGRSDYNVTNAFKLFGLWQPVFFHGNNLLEKLAGGWSLSGIWNVNSGFPFNPTYNIQGKAYVSNSPYGTLRPAGLLGIPGKSTSNSTFMTQNNPNYSGGGFNYFATPTYTPGPAFPNTAPAPELGIQRNSLTGPGYDDLDASLAKAFGLPNNRILGESAKFQIRADFYNLFNKTNLGTINANLGTVNPSGTVISVNPNFGVANGALGSRTIQLQARFVF